MKKKSKLTTLIKLKRPSAPWHIMKWHYLLGSDKRNVIYTSLCLKIDHDVHWLKVEEYDTDALPARVCDKCSKIASKLVTKGIDKGLKV